MEDTEVPYFVGIDCCTGKGEYGISDSLTRLAFAAANIALGKESVYACCREKHEKRYSSFLKIGEKEMTLIHK